LHLQAKQLAGQLSHSLEHGEIQVKKASVGVPPFSGTVANFVWSQSRVVAGKPTLSASVPFWSVVKVCREKTQDGFRLFDGDSDPSFRAQGPQLLHHRFKTLEQIQVARREIWKEIVSHEVSPPATTVRFFDETL